MPVYEYLCESCGHKFDKLMSMSAPHPTCPHKEGPPERVKSVGSEEVVGEIERASCGGKTKKLISRGSFALKGGGWFKDGY